MPEIESDKYNDAKLRKDKAKCETMKGQKQSGKEGSRQKCETMKGQKQSSKEGSRHVPPPRTLNQQMGCR
jgi:hypothetical protein